MSVFCVFIAPDSSSLTAETWHELLLNTLPGVEFLLRTDPKLGD